MPKYYMVVFFALLLLNACRTGLDAQQRTVKQLQKGQITEDTSYVYQLPFLPGKTYWVAQGYFSIFSHKNRAALDFKMKRGTTILAARGGVVIRMKEDGDRGGWNKKNRPYGNYIVIDHGDGSRAGYWHLQYNSILPNVGDTVQAGQAIGKSGKTGYALFPHLHFLAWRSKGGNWQPIGTRFNTNKGIGYLRPGRFYKKPNNTVE